MSKGTEEQMQLTSAIIKGDLAKVIELLEDQSIDSKYKNQAIYYAAERGQGSIVAKFFEYEVITSDAKQGAFISLAKSDLSVFNLNIFRSILLKDNAITSKTRVEAIKEAAREGRRSIVAILLKDKSITSAHKEEVLVIATLKAHLPIVVTVLLDKTLSEDIKQNALQKLNSGEELYYRSYIDEFHIGNSLACISNIIFVKELKQDDVGFKSLVNFLNQYNNKNIKLILGNSEETPKITIESCGAWAEKRMTRQRYAYGIAKGWKEDIKNLIKLSKTSKHNNSLIKGEKVELKTEDICVPYNVLKNLFNMNIENLCNPTSFETRFVNDVINREESSNQNQR